MLGTQHYARIHKDELHTRTTCIINFDTVGNKRLKYIRRSGGFTSVNYQGDLFDSAENLSQPGQEYDFISAGEHHVGDFDSVWFVRAGLSALTIASYDDEDLMPRIHTPFDTLDHVDLDQVKRSALFGEALVLSLVDQGQTL